MMSASVRETLGYVYLVTNQGTLALGRTTFSNAVWKAAELLARGESRRCHGRWLPAVP